MCNIKHLPFANEYAIKDIINDMSVMKQNERWNNFQTWATSQASSAMGSSSGRIWNGDNSKPTHHQQVFSKVAQLLLNSSQWKYTILPRIIPVLIITENSTGILRNEIIGSLKTHKISDYTTLSQFSIT